MTSINEGGWDRAVRLIVGVLLLFAGWRMWSTFGIVVIGIGAIAVFTGAIGWCPAYTMFGWSTRRTKVQGPQP